MHIPRSNLSNIPQIRAEKSELPGKVDGTNRQESIQQRLFKIGEIIKKTDEINLTISMEVDVKIDPAAAIMSAIFPPLKRATSFPSRPMKRGQPGLSIRLMYSATSTSRSQTICKNFFMIHLPMRVLYYHTQRSCPYGHAKGQNRRGYGLPYGSIKYQALKKSAGPAQID